MKNHDVFCSQLDKGPNGALFVVMCIIIRLVEANGAAMQNVAGYAILSQTFPDHVGIVNVSFL